MHEQTGPEGPSGFGFELTMRLKREEGEKSPPTWPAAIMQALAKYVFQSGAERLSSTFKFLVFVHCTCMSLIHSFKTGVR